MTFSKDDIATVTPELEAACRKLIEGGIYFFPMATKQCSISFAHTKENVALTLERVRHTLDRILK